MDPETEKLQKALKGIGLCHEPVPVKVDGMDVQGFVVVLKNAADFAELGRRTRDISLGFLAHELADTVYIFYVRP